MIPSDWVKDWQAVYQSTKRNLKQTMVWDNKGKNFGASYNWHKQNPQVLGTVQIQMKHMKQIYFAGGESLIAQEHYEILEEAIRPGLADKLEIRYNPNGVEWRDDPTRLMETF